MRAFRAFIVQELLLSLCDNLTSESNMLISMAVNFETANFFKRWHVGHIKPRNRSWTGWSVRFLGCRARHNDAEWLFHSKEL